jgi:hypothetical protein
MNWEAWLVVVCSGISLICRIVMFLLEEDDDVIEMPVMNRQQRRHPNGLSPARKFCSVNYTGRQKQGNGKAVKGW